MKKNKKYYTYNAFNICRSLPITAIDEERAEFEDKAIDQEREEENDKYVSPVSRWISNIADGSSGETIDWFACDVDWQQDR